MKKTLFDTVKNVYGNQKISDFVNGKDPLFPENMNSIYSKNSDGYLYDYQKYYNEPEPLELKYSNGSKIEVEFKSLQDVFGDFSVEEEIHSEKSEQGTLGDCYFIEVIQSLSQFGKILLNRIRKVQNKLYEIIFIIDGLETKVLINDSVPFHKNSKLLLFGSPTEELNIYYLCLFEKAFAKICGGYLCIKSGFSYEIGKLIIGYKHKYIDLYDYINDNNKVNQLLDELKDIKNEGNSLVSVGISTGFDSGHAITLVNINDRYITIKDPHGKKPKNLEKIKDMIIQESSIEQNEKNRIEKNFEKTGLLEVPLDFLKKKRIYYKNGNSKERALFNKIIINFLPDKTLCKTFKIKNLMSRGKLNLFYTKNDEQNFNCQVEVIKNYWRAHRNFLDENNQAINVDIDINENIVQLRLKLFFVEDYEPYTINTLQQKKTDLSKYSR